MTIAVDCVLRYRLCFRCQLTICVLGPDLVFYNLAALKGLRSPASHLFCCVLSLPGEAVASVSLSLPGRQRLLWPSRFHAFCSGVSCRDLWQLGHSRSLSSHARLRLRIFLFFLSLFVLLVVVLLCVTQENSPSPPPPPSDGLGRIHA